MSLGGSGSLLATRVLQRGRQREPKQPLSDKMRKIAFLGIQSCHENRMRIDSTHYNLYCTPASNVAKLHSIVR